MLEASMSAFAALVLAAAPVAAASLVTSGGKVIGASEIFYDDGVTGHGDWWDVEFRAGDCVATLDGCSDCPILQCKARGRPGGSRPP
jgi:hypothetical protein